MKLYELIKEKRENKGLTQENVAQILNVTRQAVQNWEKNKRAIPNELLAEYFNLLELNAHEILSVFDFLESNNLIMTAIDYSSDAIITFEKNERNTILTNYPTLYLGVGQKLNQDSGQIKQLVYVGEASSIVRRTTEHLRSSDDKLNAIKSNSDGGKNYFTSLDIQNLINLQHLNLSKCL